MEFAFLFAASRMFDFDLSGSIKSLVMKLITENLSTIGLGVGGLLAASMGLGVLKKLGARLFSGALNAGDGIAHGILQKPRAVALLLTVSALVAAGGYLYHRFGPEKVIVKPVTVDRVIDAEAIAAAETRQREAEHKLAAAETTVKSAQAEVNAAKQARDDALQQTVKLSQRINELAPPDGDEKALERLKNSLDFSHARVVSDELSSGSSGTYSSLILGGQPQPEQLVGYTRNGGEVWRPVPDPEEAKKPKANPRAYQSWTHKNLATDSTKLETESIDYHRGNCPICKQNYAIRTQMDAIYERLAEAAKKERFITTGGDFVEHITPESGGKVKRELISKREYNRLMQEKQERRDLLTREITVFGETKSVAEWNDDTRCEAKDLDNLLARLELGWTPEDAVKKKHDRIREYGLAKKIQKLKELLAQKRRGEFVWVKSYDDPNSEEFERYEAAHPAPGQKAAAQAADSAAKPPIDRIGMSNPAVIRTKASADASASEGEPVPQLPPVAEKTKKPATRTRSMLGTASSPISMEP
jgi:hypothetical protein